MLSVIYILVWMSSCVILSFHSLIQQMLVHLPCTWSGEVLHTLHTGLFFVSILTTATIRSLIFPVGGGGNWDSRKWKNSPKVTWQIPIHFFIQETMTEFLLCLWLDARGTAVKISVPYPKTLLGYWVYLHLFVIVLLKACAWGQGELSPSFQLRIGGSCLLASV